MKQHLPTYRRAAAILIAICFIAFLMTSCTRWTDCRGAGRQNGYIGYDDARGHKAIKGPKRISF